MGELQKVHLLFDEQLTEKEKVASPNCTFLDQILESCGGISVRETLVDFVPTKASLSHASLLLVIIIPLWFLNNTANLEVVNFYLFFPNWDEPAHSHGMDSSVCLLVGPFRIYFDDLSRFDFRARRNAPKIRLV